MKRPLKRYDTDPVKNVLTIFKSIETVVSRTMEEASTDGVVLTFDDFVKVGLTWTKRDFKFHNIFAGYHNDRLRDQTFDPAII